MNKLLSLLLLSFPLATMAQSADDGWGRNLRPEHITVEDTPTAHTWEARPVRRVGAKETAALTSIGAPHIPVVLVAFQDRPFSVADTPEGVAEFYNNFCNAEGYTAHGSKGSIRDYFRAQSLEAFDPQFTIIGPVTLPEGYATYGRNSGNSKDVGFSQFRTDAMNEATKLDIDWSLFDNDHNGTVDMVFFVYAGWGESNTSGLDPNAIWAKEMTSQTTVGGHVFATSAACHELRVNTAKPLYDDEGTLIDFAQKKADGIGVFIHELSHALGLPDFYDTRGVAFGMDLWSVMDYGEYGNNGYTPGGYTAYERDFMGWQPLETLTETQDLTLLPFAQGGKGYKIENPDNPDEYYIIENRQPQGWDEMVCTLGHGLQATYVDYSRSAWVANAVNTDPNHQRMTILAANDNYKGTNAASSTDEWLECLAGNLYPGSSNNPLCELFPEPTPRALSAITELPDGTITLHFQGTTPTDVINSPEAKTNKRSAVYDLTGRRLGRAPEKGIYIVEGKKYIAPQF